MLKNFIKCICTVFKYGAFPAVVLFFLSVFTGLTLPFTVLYTQKLIDSIILFLENSIVLSSVLWNAALLALIILFMNHVNFISNIAFIYLEKKLTYNLSEAVLTKMLKIDFACFEDPALHDALKEIRNRPAKKVINLFKECRAFLCDSIKLFGMIFIFAKVSRWLSLGFFVFLVLDFINEYIATKKIQAIYASQVFDERELEDLSSLLSNKEALPELKIFSAVPFIVKKFKDKYKVLLKERISITLKSYRYMGIASVIMIAWFSFLIFVLIRLVIRGGVSAGMFTGFITSLTEIYYLLALMSQSFWGLIDDNKSIDFLYTFMNLPHDIHYKEICGKEKTLEKEILKQKNFDKKNAIIFENVSFSYPNSEKEVLKNISFRIEPGSHIALVGRNGSGKTSLIKLITGLYKPSSGSIFIGTKNIKSLSRAELHRNFSVVFQDYASYQMSLRENAALGCIEFLNDDEHLKKSLALVSDDPVFDDLDKHLGKLEESGVELSGGQRQKLAIARACAAKSDFIIFDEPTASLDPSAEREMYQNLQKIIDSSNQGRGCIFISHRLASAKMADLIFVLDEGKIIEKGSHDELIQQGGLYSKMYKEQASWYQEV
ncbi:MULTISPECIES: ABC transporter ATP-binding protein [unclassified Treponema]|uniref:ABC transporter ATP-binding protein n=1 Tax=unclassified Treponema TaxID=2638727 RepID=UPI0020A55055|nr:MULTISPECIES: ABC transporter ATP-binding protein [unclassified Treponema]UTC67711.1 ABC transporter ATP-binding protein [Treponema sp. OMZ 789]UTC70439.1 ABC transporter ATP-binding protein [Treponema sp. OMZ 790]UTC73152.1 ABC transporter ATP-binding protein [Treponema sp. OMZ 791]